MKMHGVSIYLASNPKIDLTYDSISIVLWFVLFSFSFFLCYYLRLIVYCWRISGPLRPVWSYIICNSCVFVVARSVEFRSEELDEQMVFR